MKTQIPFPEHFPAVRLKGLTRWNSLYVLFFSLGLLFMVSCRVQLIANRDETFISKTLTVARMVDEFYMQLAESDTSALHYTQWSLAYDRIELELRQLRLIASSKPLNSETERICQLLLEQWQTTRNRHREKKFYPKALLSVHQDRFSEYFMALLNVEKAKEFKIQNL